MTQQKIPGVPLQLKTAVEAEIKKLVNPGDIGRIDKITDEVYIQPVVITVTRNKTVKIALDARLLPFKKTDIRFQTSTT